MENTKFEKIRLASFERTKRTSLSWQRGEMESFDWSPRLMAIKGARGVGKTTLLLQHLKKTYNLSPDALYLSLDDIFFTENRLLDTIAHFQQEGGKVVYLDEVHKYPTWAIELKNAYDTYHDLQFYFTGSSMLEIHTANADLSRRAIVYHLQGLSFRQFLRLEHGIEVPRFSLENILKKPNLAVEALPAGTKPYPLFRAYLKHGYYPFFTEGKKWFHDRLKGTLRAVIESDLPQLQNVDARNAPRIFQLLLALSTSPPFKPNIAKLSERTGISRSTLLQYLTYLEQADILALLRSNRTGITSMQKPEKLFFENPNLLFNVSPLPPQTGMVRETFVLNQLKNSHQVNYPDTGDFLVDGKYTLEVGGAKKTAKTLGKLEGAYIIADEIDFAVGKKIPIWLLGLLY